MAEASRFTFPEKPGLKVRCGSCGADLSKPIVARGYAGAYVLIGNGKVNGVLAPLNCPMCGDAIIKDQPDNTHGILLPT